MKTVPELRNEIEQELMLANQLLLQIQNEVREIKNFTSGGGPLDKQICKSAALLNQLERMRQVRVEPAAGRHTVHPDNSEQQTMMSSYEQHYTFRGHSL